jgi:hypothetical protein
MHICVWVTDQAWLLFLYWWIDQPRDIDESINPETSSVFLYQRCVLQSDTPQTIRDCNPRLKHTGFHHMAPTFTIWNHMAPCGTIRYHMANTAQDRRWKRYIRIHISDSLILCPKDQIISFIQLHYKASQLTTLCGILWALLVGLHTSSLIHLFTCLSLTHCLSDRDPMCSLSKLALQQLLSILAPALSGLPGNEL